MIDLSALSDDEREFWEEIKTFDSRSLGIMATLSIVALANSTASETVFIEHEALPIIVLGSVGKMAPLIAKFHNEFLKPRASRTTREEV